MIALAAALIVTVAAAQLRAYVLLTRPRGRHLTPRFRRRPVEARLAAALRGAS